MSWDNLSFREKAEIIKVGVKNGLRNIDSIRSNYNSFDGSYSSIQHSGGGLNNKFDGGGPMGADSPSNGTLLWNGMVNGAREIVHGIDSFAESAEDPLLFTTMGLEGATVVAPNPYTAAGAYVTSLAGAGIDAWQTGRALMRGDWQGAMQNGAELGLGLIGAKYAKKAANSYNVAEGTRTVTRKGVRTAGRKTKVVTKRGTVTAKSKAGEQTLRSAAVSVPIEVSQAYYHNKEGVSDWFAQQERLRQERLSMTQPTKRRNK